MKIFIYKKSIFNFILNKYTLLALLLCVIPYSEIQSQEEENKYSFNAGLELNSKYVWRGVPFGNAPVIFPSIGFNYKNFSTSATGGYSLNGSHSEVVLFFIYSPGDFSFGIGDYFFPNEEAIKDSWLNFKKKETVHTIEAYGTYSPSRLPFWVTASSFVYGNDRKGNGNNYFSSYLEVGYYKQFTNSDKLSFIIGCTPFEGFYANAFAVVNTSIKYDTSIPLGTYSLPVSGAFVLNPNSEKVFLTFSIYLSK